MQLESSILWNNNWIQKFESNWSIFEKLRFANVITGNELLDYFAGATIKGRKVANLSDKKRSLKTLDNLCDTKLYSVFKSNLQNNQDLFMIDICKLFSKKHHLDLFNEVLKFCPKCISAGYHSFFHQVRLFNNCAFHPEEGLITLCNKCDNEFRSYSIGKKEEPFCCQHCGHCLLQHNDFQITKKEWYEDKAIQYNIVKQFIAKSKELSANYNIIIINPYSSKKGKVSNDDYAFACFANDICKINTVKLFGNIRTLNNRVQNLRFNSLNTSYQHNKLTTQFRNKFRTEQMSKRTIENSLLFDCYLQSKSIFKAANRFILEKIIPNSRGEIRNSLAFKHPFNDLTIELNNPELFAYLEWRNAHVNFNLIGSYDYNGMINKFEISLSTLNNHKWENAEFNRGILNSEPIQLYTNHSLKYSLTSIIPDIREDIIAYPLYTYIINKCFFKSLIYQFHLIKDEMSKFILENEKTSNKLRTVLDIKNKLPLFCFIFDKKSNHLVYIM